MCCTSQTLLLWTHNQRRWVRTGEVCDLGEVNGKRRHGRPMTSYSSNITKWTSESMARITRETRDGAGVVRYAARAADHHSWWDRERRKHCIMMADLIANDGAMVDLNYKWWHDIRSNYNWLNNVWSNWKWWHDGDLIDNGVKTSDLTKHGGMTVDSITNGSRPSIYLQMVVRRFDLIRNCGKTSDIIANGGMTVDRITNVGMPVGRITNGSRPLIYLQMVVQRLILLEMVARRLAIL